MYNLLRRKEPNNSGMKRHLIIPRNIIALPTLPPPIPNHLFRIRYLIKSSTSRPIRSNIFLKITKQKFTGFFLTYQFQGTIKFTFVYTVPNVLVLLKIKYPPTLIWIRIRPKVADPCGSSSAPLPPEPSPKKSKAQTCLSHNTITGVLPNYFTFYF